MTSEVLFEFIRQGAYVKVTAIDAESGREVSMVGDPSVGEETLKRLALRKLLRVLDRDGAGKDGGSGGRKGPGIVV